MRQGVRRAEQEEQRRPLPHAEGAWTAHAPLRSRQRKVSVSPAPSAASREAEDGGSPSAAAAADGSATLLHMRLSSETWTLKGAGRSDRRGRPDAAAHDVLDAGAIDHTQPLVQRVRWTVVVAQGRSMATQRLCVSASARRSRRDRTAGGMARS